MTGTPLDIVMLVLGLALLAVGGDVLVRGSVALAYRLGISPLVVGLTIVAFGTSAPELAFSLSASLDGNSGLVFGNVVGSNICNIGLILGISALMKPLRVHASLIRREIPMMILAMLGMTAMGYLPPEPPGGGWGYARVEGAILLGVLAAYTVVAIAIARRQRVALATYARDVEQISRTERERSIASAVGLVVLGGAILAGGGWLTRIGAVGIAQKIGIPNEIIGLTIVAVGTSLPELAASIAAARRNQIDMAVGNIVGSNIFNVLFVFGVSVVASPVTLPAAAAESLTVMLGFAAMMLFVSRTHSGIVSRLEGAALLLAYALYLAHQSWMAVDAVRSGSAGGG